MYQIVQSIKIVYIGDINLSGHSTADKQIEFFLKIEMYHYTVHQLYNCVLVERHKNNDNLELNIMHRKDRRSNDFKL